MGGRFVVAGYGECWIQRIRDAHEIVVAYVAPKLVRVKPVRRSEVGEFRKRPVLLLGGPPRHGAPLVHQVHHGVKGDRL